jgi:NAD(P)-dependent dehydrogenase (short-subunit alcohol dehydrogenase family)
MEANPIIIVTGASRNLGAAVACWLATVGAPVAMDLR